MPKSETPEWVEIEAVNWREMNPRSDRKNHSWFRVENTIATYPKFFHLSCAQRFIAVCLWAEISKKCGERAKIHLPTLASQLRIKPSEIHKTIQALVSSGVLRLPDGVERCPPDSLRTYVRTNETNETNGRDEGAKAPDLPRLAILWNQHRGRLPAVRACGDARWKAAEARWREKPEESYWTEVIRRLAGSPFCCGDNQRGWCADFDFLVKPETHIRTLEGKYDPRGPAPGTGKLDWSQIDLGGAA